jgi:hypothetical protein
MAAKVFGIESSSFSGLTISGAIIEGGELSREQGDLRKLTGNPCTTIADTRSGSADHYIMNVSFEFESYTDPVDLLGTEVTGTVTSEDTVAVTLTGLLTKWVVAFEKENWWKATATIEADKAAV